MFYFFFYLNVNATIFLYYYTSTTIGFNQTMDKLTQDSLRFSYNFCDKQVYQRAILKRYSERRNTFQFQHILGLKTVIPSFLKYS